MQLPTSFVEHLMSLSMCVGVKGAFAALGGVLPEQSVWRLWHSPFRPFPPKAFPLPECFTSLLLACVMKKWFVHPAAQSSWSSRRRWSVCLCAKLWEESVDHLHVVCTLSEASSLCVPHNLGKYPVCIMPFSLGLTRLCNNVWIVKQCRISHLNTCSAQTVTSESHRRHTYTQPNLTLHQIARNMAIKDSGLGTCSAYGGLFFR